MNISSLSKEGDFVVLRRSDKDMNNTFNELGKLWEDAIELRRIPHLSINLLGGDYKKEYIKYNTRKTGSIDPTKEWNGKDIIYLYEYLDCITEQKNTCSPIFFRINQINEKKYPYFRTNDANLKKVLEKLNRPIPTSGNDKIPFEGVTSIVHAPTLLNYWHVELLLIDEEGKIISDNKAPFKKTAAEYVLNQILYFYAYKDLPNENAIPTSYYKTDK